MSLVAERERRQTAGNRLKRLLEQQEDQEDEFYGTAYGGFVDEAEDNDYDSEESEEDVVDSDFDQEDNDQQNNNGDEKDDSNKKGPSSEQNDNDNDNNDGDDDDQTVTRKRKKVIYQAQSLQQEIKAQQKKADQESNEQKVTRQQQKKALPSTIEAKTLRTSTSVKRVELEKRQKERQERRNYMKGVESMRNTREVRRLTQEELLEEAKITEKINLASLEAYQQIELKKKEIKRMKLTQECPRICVSSIPMSTESKPIEHESWNILVDDATSFAPVSDRCSRTFISFTDAKTYQETYPKLSLATNRPRRRRLCPITNLPAQYFDPVTQMPYANLQAFQILRRIYAEELKKQKRTPSVLIDTQRDVNLNILR